jgi:hypothetical protein
MAKYKNIRISLALGERLERHAQRLPKMSLNSMAELACESICDMIEDPAKRHLPPFIAQIDAVVHFDAKASRLPKAGSSYRSAIVEIGDTLRAAEEPPKPISKKKVV